MRHLPVHDEGRLIHRSKRQEVQRGEQCGLQIIQICVRGQLSSLSHVRVYGRDRRNSVPATSAESVAYSFAHSTVTR
ncbi:hypothetical protein DPMN_088223 [Dreissena polymorpha]|uniref:Uncharacterized protein n=1 Tax=Dreissena polymorpha TaxID=45954 RepID=A0A9D4KUM9_DREPO|nr:hypothetical protein DPMN_088223 [Dreissena polymorpha]